MKRVLLYLLLSTIPILASAQNKNHFICSIKAAYETCAYLHPCDTLIYIPIIMNLADRDFSAWDTATVTQKRDLFYSFFSNPINLACVYAIDLNNSKLFFDPTGEILYGCLKKYRHYGKIHKKYIPAPFHTWVSVHFWEALIAYLQTHKIDLIFRIENIGCNPDRPLWILEGENLYVISYSSTSKCFHEYDADDFIREKAPDDCFFSLSDFSL